MNFLQDKTLYYSMLLFANFLICFSVMPLVYETSMLKMTINIPFFSLVCLGVAFIIFTIVSILRKYWVHVFIYFIAFIGIIILFVNKIQYDKNNLKIKKEIIELEYKKISTSEESDE